MVTCRRQRLGPSPRHRLEVTRGLNPYVERFRAVDVRPIASRLIIAALPRVQHVELDETAELDLSIQLYGFDLLRIDGRELLRSPLSTRREELVEPRLHVRLTPLPI